MADTKIEKEDVELLKPFGMPCVINKKFMCGSFDNIDDFYQWGGEKHCRNFCIGKTGKPGHNKKADRVNEGLAHNEAYSGSPAYKLALENSVNNGLISRRKLDAYTRGVEEKRAKGRMKLKEIRRI